MDGTNVSSDSLAAWAANGSMLRRDNPTADGVELLQWLLTSFGFQPGPHDGIFGGRTESAVIDYQEHRVLNPDGIVGPVTKADMLAAWRYGWAVGQSANAALALEAWEAAKATFQGVSCVMGYRCPTRHQRLAGRPKIERPDALRTTRFD